MPKPCACNPEDTNPSPDPSPPHTPVLLETGFILNTF